MALVILGTTAAAKNTQSSKIYLYSTEAKAIQIDPLESLSKIPTREEVISAVNWVMSNNELGEDFKITITCESNFIYWAYGDNRKAYGIGQFHKPTWNYFNRLAGTKLDYYSTKDQLKMMLWAWKDGYKKHWSCYTNIFGK